MGPLFNNTPGNSLPADAARSVWPTFFEAVEFVGLLIDAAGVIAILGGVAIAVVRFARYRRSAQLQDSEQDCYRRFRQDLGRGILLGLEFLVAADIVRTVALTPTLESVIVLGIIVMIRTFLSIALQVELEGTWPWQRSQTAASFHPQHSSRATSPGSDD